MEKTWIEINRKNLLSNLSEFEKVLNNKASIMAVIKANAYGHDTESITSILKSKNVMLGVDSLEEAMLVKSFAPKKEIMILGYIPKKNLITAIKNDFHISIYNPETIEYLNNVVNKNILDKRKIKAHVKIETGTNRLGLNLEEIRKINMPNIFGIYTHLADSENINSQFYKKQIAKFAEAKNIFIEKNIFPRLTHISCTAAIMQHGNLDENLVRLGISLYGLWPNKKLENTLSPKINLKPVLSWKTRLAQVKKVKKGETISYDRTYKTRKDTNIGIIPVGYFDGLDRKLSNCGQTIINGKKVEIVGRICMNMAMVNLGNINAKSGDEVVLIGKDGREEISANDIADKIGTINYEVVSRINPLIKRVIR